MSTMTETAPIGRALRISLWVAQTLIFLTFVAAGLVKLLTPIP